MTIKELEERMGMTRANIRFYEDEGLLRPRRLPNGYRDYSEEDVLTLEKIKLLRQLHLDINTIRLVQEGKLSLEQAMFSQLNRLEGDKTAIQRAVEVCRGIERSGVEYGALEPKVWLKELEAPSRPQMQSAPTPPKPTELQLHHWSHRAYHPWMRMFARGVDMALYSLLFEALFLLVFRWYGYLNLPLLVEILVDIGLLVFTLLLEPLWLHYVGWTPGKWIFGLKLRDQNGEKLSLKQAWDRCWRVAWEGYGWNIPIWGLWRHWKCYKQCSDHEDCPWDAEEGYIYTREERKLYGLWWLGAELATLGLVVLVVLGMFLPVNMGGLTVKEFSQNYNDRMKLYETESTRLTDAGTWVREEADTSGSISIMIDDGFVYSDNKINTGSGWVELIGETRWLDPEYTVEDGEVTAVTFTMESTRNFVDASYFREMYGFLAFSGAVDGLNVFNYDPDAWVESWQSILGQSDAWENFEFTYRGMRIAQTVELSGYEELDSGLLSSTVKDGHSCTRTITFSLIGSEP